LGSSAEDDEEDKDEEEKEGQTGGSYGHLTFVADADPALNSTTA